MTIKTFSIAQFIGVTQWETPIDSQNLSEVTGITGDDKYLHNDNYYKDPSEVAGNAPNFLENPSAGAEKDPWDDVVIDDDDDYTRLFDENQIDSRSNNKNRKGSADDSDVDDWYDDRFQQQMSNGKGIGRKRSPVTKTMSAFRMGFSSLKSMLKQKTSKINENGLYGDRGTQTKEGPQDYGVDQNDQMGSLNDKYSGYEVQSRRNGNINPSKNSNDYVGSDYGSSSSDGYSSNFDGGRRNENFSRDQRMFKMQSPERDGDSQQTNNLHSGSLPSSSFSDVDRGGDKQQPVDADDKNSERKVVQDSRNYTQKNDLIKRGDRGEDIGDGEHGKNKKDPRNSEFTKSSSFDRGEQEYSPWKKDGTIKKISVRSMGKLDESLWADYVDSDEKITSTVPEEYFSSDNSPRRNSIFIKKLKAISLSNLIKGIQNWSSVLLRLLSYTVPLTNRLAFNLLFVALSAAPISTIVFLCLSLLRDLLLPLGLLYVTCSVRPTVEALKVSSLLFSGKDSSAIIISPPDSVEDLKEDSSGKFRSDSSFGTYEVDVSDVDSTNNVLGSGTLVNIGDAAIVRPTSEIIITAGTGTRTSVDTDDNPTTDTTASSSSTSTSTSKSESIANEIAVGVSKPHPLKKANFMQYMHDEENSIPSTIKSETTGKKDSVKKESQNFEKLDANFNFDRNSDPHEILGSENSNSNYQEIFYDNFQIFSSATSTIKNLLKNIFQDFQNLNQKIVEIPRICVFLGFVFFSLVLCGVILPEIKKKLGEKVAEFLEKRVKVNKMKKIKSENMKNKKIIDQINKLEIEESDEYSSDDEEEQFDVEERGFFQKKLFSMSRKIKKVFTPRKKISKNFILSDQIENSDFSDEFFIENILSVKSERRSSDAKNSFSDNMLLIPINLMTSVMSMYTSFYCSLLLSFIITLLNIENDLKYAMISPYLLFCVLTTLESYVHQPSFKIPSNYNRFNNSNRNNNENNLYNGQHSLNDE